MYAMYVKKLITKNAQKCAEDVCRGYLCMTSVEFNWLIHPSIHILMEMRGTVYRYVKTRKVIDGDFDYLFCVP
jgi:hypothetical protein